MLLNARDSNEKSKSEQRKFKKKAVLNMFSSSAPQFIENILGKSKTWMSSNIFPYVLKKHQRMELIIQFNKLKKREMYVMMLL